MQTQTNETNENYDVDKILRHYLIAAVWSSSDPDSMRPLDEKYSTDDLTKASRERARADVVEFVRQIAAVVGEIPDDACTQGEGRYGLEKMLGHDFWLTRCGHGCGFWDGDWADPYAAQLDSIAKDMGEAYIGPAGNNRHLHYYS